MRPSAQPEVRTGAGDGFADSARASVGGILLSLTHFRQSHPDDGIVLYSRVWNGGDDMAESAIIVRCSTSRTYATRHTQNTTHEQEHAT